MTIIALIANLRISEERDNCDETIKEIVRRRLCELCRLFPNSTAAGREFARIMSDFNTGHGDIAFAKTIDKLIDKAMNARDDLRDYPQIRKLLIGAICNT